MSESKCPNVYVVVLEQSDTASMVHNVHSNKESAEQTLQDCGGEGYILSRGLQK